jgi:hypothetical protein
MDGTTSLPANATDLQLVAMWDMVSPLEGNIVLVVVQQW